MRDPDVLTELGRIVTDLRALGVPFAVVGGLAVSVRAEVRTTLDVDIAIAVDQAGLERLVLEVAARGYQIAKLVEHDTAGRTATVRLFTDSGLLVDLLAASSGVETDLVDAATVVELDPVGSIPVATAEDLLALKVLASSQYRPQDRVDALSLLRVNPDLDLDRVRGLLRTITERGYARGQDLDGKLDDLLREAGR